MRNRGLAADYVLRSQKRLKALQTLFDEQSWADVVREAQEIVELTLKGLLRHANIEVPRLHDVSAVLEENRDLLPSPVHKHVTRLGKISHQMRRDRELAFYGSEDLTPSEFYKRDDAEKAKEDAAWVVSIVSGIVRPPT